MEELLSSLLVELRRGTLTLAVLSQLRLPQYGYSLGQTLEDKNSSIDAGTLYPLLRRLEKQGLLSSEWDTSDSRPRKYYILSDQGRQIYQRLKMEWESLAQQMHELLAEEEEEHGDN